MLTPAPAVVSTFLPSRSLNVLMPESGLTRTASVPVASIVATDDDGRALRRDLHHRDSRGIGEGRVLVGDEADRVAGAVALLDHNVESVLVVVALVDAEEEDGMRAVEQPVGAQVTLSAAKARRQRQCSRERRGAGRCERAAAGELQSCCLPCRVGHEQPPVSLFAFEDRMRPRLCRSGSASAAPGVRPSG